MTLHHVCLQPRGEPKIQCAACESQCPAELEQNTVNLGWNRLWGLHGVLEVPGFTSPDLLRIPLSPQNPSQLGARLQFLMSYSLLLLGS